MEEQTRQPKGQSETVWITGHVNTTMLYSAELWPLTISHKRKSWMPHTTSFNDDSWVLHGKTKCAMKSTHEIRRNYKEWTSSSRKEDWDGWDMCCAWKTTGYQNKPHDSKWTHAPEEEPEGRLNWIDTVTRDLKSTGTAWEDAEQAAVDREDWRGRVAQCVFDTGWTKV